jgi:hypothetical protein
MECSLRYKQYLSISSILKGKDDIYPSSFEKAPSFSLLSTYFTATTMKFLQMHPSNLATLTSALLFLTPSVFADDCCPVTWTGSGQFNTRAATSLTPAPTPSITSNSSNTIITTLSSGDINCRSWADTYEDVNYYTCTELCQKYQIATDCSNIMQQTTYCVDGCKLCRKIGRK